MSADAAYQGAPGAFSEDAAQALLGGGLDLLPCARFVHVFDAVESGRARFGVVPIENTVAGSVQPVHDLLADRELCIMAETVVRVAHALVGVPGSRAHEIRQVLSHPVALAQCESFFRSRPEVEPVPVYDTAGAVLQVVGEGRRHRAAIASRRAAALHGGMVLAEGLEDDPANFTRFLLLSPEAEARASAGHGFKTSLIMTVPHQPGALCAALRVFAARGLDLLKIESRPLRGRPFEYSFWLDVAGHAEDPPVAEALMALEEQSGGVRVLGSYRRADEGVPRGK
jgi:prephenate dehydratase